MSAKDSFKARRTTGGSRPASEVSTTLRQGVTMGVINKLPAAFSSRQPTEQERRQRLDTLTGHSRGSGKDCQEAAQQAGSEGNSQAENVRVGGAGVRVTTRKNAFISRVVVLEQALVIARREEAAQREAA